MDGLLVTIWTLLELSFFQSLNIFCKFSYVYRVQIMLLTDPEVESSLLISSDEGATFQKYRLNFYILSLLFHPEQEDWILAYSHDQKVNDQTACLTTPCRGLMIVGGIQYILTVPWLSDNSSTAPWSLGEDGSWCMKKWLPIVSTGKYKTADSSAIYQMSWNDLYVDKLDCHSWWCRIKHKRKL